MSAFQGRMKSEWRAAGLVLGLGAFAFLSGIGSWLDQLKGMRQVNEQDEIFRYVAQEIAEPALCDKIPWSVATGGGFFIEPSYERSECYAFIAGWTKNPQLCWKVRRLGAFHLLSEQTSMWSCLRDARRGMNAGIAVSPASLVDFFGRLGYDPDTIHLEGITPPVVSVKDIYRQLPERPGIVTRIEKATGDSGRSAGLTDNDATNLAYLEHVAALVTQNPNWCARIPEDLKVASEPARFRDWCLFTLATNTKDARLCGRIPIPANQRDVRLSLQATCMFQVNSPYPSNLRYGPEVPDDDERTRTLITMLNYEIPRAKDLPLESIYAAYDRFLNELNHGTDPRHAAARQRFIQRVQSLP